jgi:glycosyltransferase involved in cell wall biosynthesis
MMPLVSIVIANYNYGRFIEEAIESVISQSCQDFELIVCDAASTDESVAVIKKVYNLLERQDIVDGQWHVGKRISWVSEKDGGQSAAFNKGFARAKGRFLTWLNADDVMLPGTIERLKNAADKWPDQEWFVGGCFWLDPKMKIVNMGRGRPFSKIRYREGNVSVWGPSSFFTRRLIDSVGGVDERFHYMMDADLWLRMAMNGARYRPFCKYAWGLRLHPDAKMSGHNFNSEGKLKLGSLNALNEKQQEAERQKRREVLWMNEYFKPCKSTKFTRFLSANYYRTIAARAELFYYHGKYYKEYFK